MNKKDTNTPVRKSSKRKIVKRIGIIALLVGVLAGISISGWFAYGYVLSQTQRIDVLEQSNRETLDDLAETSGVVDDLNTRLMTQEKTIDTQQNPEIATVGLQVGSVVRDKGDYGDDTSVGLMYVDITLTNESDIEGYFYTGQLKLKDSSNQVHPLCEDSAIGYYVCQSGLLSLPKGKTELRSQNIPAGDVISGTLGFYAPRSVNEFTLVYNEENYSVKVN